MSIVTQSFIRRFINNWNFNNINFPHQTHVAASHGSAMCGVCHDNVSEKAIDGAKANLAWLSSVIPSANSNTARLITTDARALESVIPPHSIDAIITEPYLGPPLTGKESENVIQNIINELEQLYKSVFTTFHQILSSNGRLIIIFPIIHHKRISIECFVKSGFTQDKFFAKLYDDKKRGSLLYQRERQKVRREIFALNKI